ncbi:MAG: hypothetical protein K6U07_06100, partial [Firmicutes bacterium]|nr:hypothetical protein [Bacillota bacterium]
MDRVRRPLWVTAAVALLALLVSPTAGDAQTGLQLVVTVAFSGPIRPAGGAYYIPFTVDESILRGPQPDSTNWTHYVLLRGGRFFFGRVPTLPYRPFGFEAIRPPEPFFFGEVLPDGRTIRARVPLASLQTDTLPPSRVKVNVVNDYVDAPASGQVTLLLPQGWSADRTTFDYELPALGEVTFPVTITRPPDSQGQIKLRFTRDGQEFQDVLEVGRAVEPTFTLRLEEGKLVAAVENPGSESLECEVAIASPVETWPAELVG